jgi:hypothetical protein
MKAIATIPNHVSNSSIFLFQLLGFKLHPSGSQGWQNESYFFTSSLIIIIGKENQSFREFVVYLQVLSMMSPRLVQITLKASGWGNIYGCSFHYMKFWLKKITSSSLRTMAHAFNPSYSGGS